MSSFSAYGRLCTTLASLLFAPAALSHVTLQTNEAPIDSRFKAVFGVPHGCQGSPTVKIRIRIPDGVIGVKPQPKAGWTLQTVKGEYAQPHTLHGASISSGIKELSWSGGPLDDEHYDEFVFVSYLSGDLRPGAILFFPVIQECENGVERWIDTPAPSQQKDQEHTHSPAPGLKLLPKP